LHRVIKNYRHV